MSGGGTGRVGGVVVETAGAEEGQPPPQPVATPLGFRLIGGNEGAEGKGPIVYVRNRVGGGPHDDGVGVGVEADTGDERLAAHAVELVEHRCRML